MYRALLCLLGLLLVCGCGEPIPAHSDAKILLLGDSLFAANRASGGSVAEVLEATLGEEVIDRSVVGARYFYALPISGSAGLRLSAQYRPGPWKIVIVNGGGNDLLFGCGCGHCDRLLNRLISADARQGAIPEFVAQLQHGRAQVFYVGYMRNPGVRTLIKACRPSADELDRRLALFDRRDPLMTFIPLANLVPFGDLSYHQFDRIHPSLKGSRAIGLLIAGQITALKMP